MKVRLHTVDTMTGESCIVDTEIAELTAAAIAAALDETEYEGLEGVCLHMTPSTSGAPTSGAFILRGNSYGEYYIAGNLYTQWADNNG